MPYQDFQDKNNSKILLRLILGVSFFSFIAGNVNSTLMLYASTTVSHVSGNLTHLGQFLASAALAEAWPIFLTLLSFFIGTMLSGFFLVKQQYASKRKYGLVTLLEGSLLLVAAKAGSYNIHFSIYLCSLSMGLQNAMISSYKGMVIRTTHMTGIVTDLGFLIGSALRKGQWPTFKILFFANILMFFLLGCSTAYFFTQKYSIESLYFSGTLTFGAGLIYYFWRAQKA